ncbi:MAG TPA: hypothetical protein VFE61_04565 [Candidatus Sulfotelmatobacter sp.]|jgi:hypothetical protein|nr:hypothetical protein [Candidatus Sulfotelmatobacter sp.]
MSTVNAAATAKGTESSIRLAQAIAISFISLIDTTMRSVMGIFRQLVAATI